MPRTQNSRGGPQTLVVLGSEVGGRWNAQAFSFVRDLVRLKAYRARGIDGGLGEALVEHASTALGGAWLQPLQPEAARHLTDGRPSGPQSLALAALVQDRGRPGARLE